MAFNVIITEEREQEDGIYIEYRPAGKYSDSCVQAYLIPDATHKSVKANLASANLHQCLKDMHTEEVINNYYTD